MNKATNSYNYNIFDKYALIWFASDEVAIMDIDDVIFLVGQEFTVDDFKRAFNIVGDKTATQVNDKYRRHWKIEAKDFLRWVDPRVEGSNGVGF